MQCRKNVYAYQGVKYCSFASVGISWMNPCIMGTCHFQFDAVNLDGMMVNARNVQIQGSNFVDSSVWC